MRNNKGDRKTFWLCCLFAYGFSMLAFMRTMTFREGMAGTLAFLFGVCALLYLVKRDE